MSALSLVMPIYCPPGGEDVVHRCLDSIEKNTDGVCRFDERIVVLNGLPFYDNWQMEGRLRDFATRLGIVREPLGFTKAFNIGLRRATGDVVQLNHDAVVPPGWLDTLVADQDRTGGVMCCDDQHLRIGPGIHKDRAWGACFYLPRAVIDKVGPWDENLNYRYSDQDYWIRCKKAGFDVSVTGNVVLEHVNSHAFKHQLRQDGIAEAVERERLEITRKHGAAGLEKWLRKQGQEAKRC